MQHSTQVVFCDECGLGNDPVDSLCAHCQQPLTARAEQSATPVTPVVVTPPPVLAVTPGSVSSPGKTSRRGQVVPVSPCDFQPGSILDGRYQILEEIGHGGFSTVYRARDLNRPRRQLAIKRIPLSQLTPRQMIDATETFNREITFLPRFATAGGIPTYYTHLTDAENWYLITSYVKGQTLEEYLQKAPGGYLKEREVVTLGAQIATILQKLHDQEEPVVFRDLKPANIMVTRGGVFLIDFGIARVFSPEKTRDTTPLGSPGFAPPEQYGKAQTDPRSDIYSLGATLQTLLTGRDPLELRAGEPSLNPQAPSHKMRGLLDEMLSPNVAQRPYYITEVKQRLQFMQNGRLATLLMGSVFACAAMLFAYFYSLLPVYMCLFPPVLMIGGAVLVEALARRVLKLAAWTPRGRRRYWWVGMLLGFVVIGFVIAFFSTLQ